MLTPPDLPPIHSMRRQRAARSKKKPAAKKKPIPTGSVVRYTGLLDGIGELLEAARRASARTVNAFMTATYWEVGRRIVEFQQGGRKRAEYGEELLRRLAVDLTEQFGRGFSKPNLERMRLLYEMFPPARNCLDAVEAIAPRHPDCLDSVERIFPGHYCADVVCTIGGSARPLRYRLCLPATLVALRAAHRPS